MPISYQAHAFSLDLPICCTRCGVSRFHNVNGAVIDLDGTPCLPPAPESSAPRIHQSDFPRPNCLAAPPICRDCRHVARPMMGGQETWLCARPSSGSPSLVTGEIEPLNVTCVSERIEPQGNRMHPICGRNGNFFEARVSENLGHLAADVLNNASNRSASVYGQAVALQSQSHPVQDVELRSQLNNALPSGHTIIANAPAQQGAVYNINTVGMQASTFVGNRVEPQGAGQPLRRRQLRAAPSQQYDGPEAEDQ